jgi:hypothetical protein
MIERREQEGSEAAFPGGDGSPSAAKRWSRWLSGDTVHE